MPYTLIITEKPAAAKKIAESLADGKPIKEGGSVPHYSLTHGKEDIIVACAVGHLYGLAEKDKKSCQFPVFDIEWKPASEMSKGSGFTKKYLCHKLIYFEEYQYIQDAISREKQLKKWNRQGKIRLIEKDNPAWRDLFLDML